MHSSPSKSGRSHRIEELVWQGLHGWRSDVQAVRPRARGVLYDQESSSHIRVALTPIDEFNSGNVSLTHN